MAARAPAASLAVALSLLLCSLRLAPASLTPLAAADAHVSLRGRSTVALPLGARGRPLGSVLAKVARPRNWGQAGPSAPSASSATAASSASVASSATAASSPSLSRHSLTPSASEAPGSPDSSSDELNSASGFRQLDPGPIVYNGGPVMTGSSNSSFSAAPTLPVYVLFYGSWTAQQQALVLSFFNGLNGPSGTLWNWWALTAKYYQQAAGTSKTIPSVVAVGGTLVDNYSQGSGPFASTYIPQMVLPYIGPGKAFPFDPQALYFVLTASDVTVSGFGTQFCGFHNYAKYTKSSSFLYAYVGMPGRYMQSCAYQSVSPNEPVTDGAISIIGHELAEAASDPKLNAWYSAQGNENGDLCAWNYLTTSRTKGYIYNQIGTDGTKFLIQSMWDVNSQSCRNGVKDISTSGPSPPKQWTPRPPPPPGGGGSSPWWCKRQFFHLLVQLFYPDSQC